MEEVTLDFDAAPGVVSASTVSYAPPTAVSTNFTESKNMRSPAELGVVETQKKKETSEAEKNRMNPKSSVKILKREINHDRTFQAIQSMQSPAAAAAAAAANFSFSDILPSMICSIAHRGMEIFFCTFQDNSKVYGVCARTRVTLQFLEIPPNSTVIWLSSNASNGMVMVGLSHGEIHTYVPKETSARKTHHSTLVSAYGRYRWVNGPIIDCRPIFVDGSKNSKSLDFQNIHISSSYDHKLLVGHGNQLAVFLAAPDELVENGELLWTARLDGNLVSASLSGDSQAIVYVLEGEGTENDNPCGARTFLRDLDDGAEADTQQKPSALERSISNASSSIGIVYKPGPFLIHTSAVTQLSFRGFGHVTSNITLDNEDEGNDLLLTFCEGENIARIFSQNSWKQLIKWATPPQTKVGWVRGLTAFNMGDLEAQKGQKLKQSQGSRRPSFSSAENSSDTAAFNTTQPSHPSTSHPSPCTSAGSWIAEITFRSAFPGLRLSRLSYMKRGTDDAQPAHFESMSAILPAGSILADGILDMKDMGLSVQGVWPAWPSHALEGVQTDMNGTLSGSAMSFLGLSSGNASANGYSNGQVRGGTHSPPSELRLIASHPKNGNVVIMEFPLWGDQGFGAMELGSPLRYLLSLSEIERASSFSKHEVVCLDYESSSKLCAQIEDSARTISITWRNQGSQLILPGPNPQTSIFSDYNSDSRTQKVKNDTYYDLSVLPVPLSLPQLKMPPSMKRDKITAIQWWPEENYGGPPQLLCLCSSGTLLIYEMPPPWSAIEPVMPSYDPMTTSANNSLAESLPTVEHFTNDGNESVTDSCEGCEYEVNITPHPEFGIGLRLEAQVDGMCAIAGSYKKHPLNGGRLPAERTGMIMLGDELLSVNEVSLEGLTFDDIIATVRQVGIDAEAGTPLCLRFRPVMANRHKAGSTAFSEHSSQAQRKSREQRMTASINLGYNKTDRVSDTKFDHGSLGAGNVDEIQQEYARIVGMISEALPKFNSSDSLNSSILLMPWNYEIESQSLHASRRASLLIVAQGSHINVKFVEVHASCNPDKASCLDLGSYELPGSSDIKSMKTVRTSTDNWCLYLRDQNDSGYMLFVQIMNTCSDNAKLSESLKASFEVYPLILDIKKDSIFRAFSARLFATMENSNKKEVFIWMATPESLAVESLDQIDQLQERTDEHRYSKFVLCIESLVDSNDEVVDFQFLPSGRLDAYPWIIIYTKTVALVYTRPGGKSRWTQALKLNYMTLPGSNSTVYPQVTVCADTRAISPADSFPHMNLAIKSLVDACDEIDYIRSDWHPESLLSYICTETNGPFNSLCQNVRGIYEWLAQYTGTDSSNHNYPVSNYGYRIALPPLKTLKVANSLAYHPYESNDSEKEDVTDNAVGLMKMLTTKPNKERNECDEQLSDLQRILCPKEAIEKDANASKLPSLIRKLNRDEIRLLWAIGEINLNPPKYSALDPPAQLALFCFSLFKQLKGAMYDSEKEDVINCKEPNDEIPNKSTSFSNHFTRRQSFNLSDGANAKPVAVATACALAALTSSNQKALVNKARPENGKIDWETARSIRLPFWVRSDDDLRNLSCEIGLAVYRKTRDIMESAIFFIIAGNMKTLKNLAATDGSLSGSKFLKFVNSYDFSSQRGRKAAEKNAFSLLRKNRYTVSAAFFLMADPPMLNTAIETIIAKSHDYDLAFLTTRLIETRVKREGDSQFGGLALGAIGGGGGFAGSGLSNEVTGVDEKGYDKWRPSLGHASKQLLRQKGVEFVKGDPCYQALQLMWLDRREEAARLLSRVDKVEPALEIFPRTFDTPTKSSFEESKQKRATFSFHAPVSKPLQSANDRVIEKANSVINFVSRPLLVKSMKCSTRSLWAATLLISNSLIERGMEVASARCILQNTEKKDLNKTVDGTNSHKYAVSSAYRKNKLHQNQKSVASKGVNVSSIFDSFDPAPTKTKQGVESGTMSSSIFDQFDPVPAKTIKKPEDNNGQISSSIFDSFDVVPAKTMKKPENSNDQMSSSIFDDFDTAPAKTIKKAENNSDQMSSSIFDGFDTAPGKVMKKAEKNSGQMSSSIFDGFDAAPGESNSKPATQSGAMNSSIFDSFDTSNQRSMQSKPETTMNTCESLPGGSKPEEDEKEDPELPSSRTPRLWMQWRNGTLADAVARRLLREFGRYMDHFHADLLDPPIWDFYESNHPLVRCSAVEVLRTPCGGEKLYDGLASCLETIHNTCQIEKALVVEQALRILGAVSQPRRIVLCTLLHTINGRTDLAEDIIRDAAISQIKRCNAFGLSNDDLVDNRKTLHHHASQHLRRLGIQVSWQLELCLWLHRSGVIPLSSTVLKESTIAVRVGLILASWGKNHDCLDMLIRNNPDCPLDHNGGRQLWSSMKMIAGLEDGSKKIGSQGSGGWEFLVDCRREEATSMLRKRLPGSFLIRPHPEDNGVFTLSFKTNLTPVHETEGASSSKAEKVPSGDKPPRSSDAKPVKKDDVVQHAIVRLSDAGFRCGSFGPFATLMKLLEAVSASLPFDLLFDKPPTEGIIKDDVLQPSPNAAFFRRFALSADVDAASRNGVVDTSRTNLIEAKSDTAEHSNDYRSTQLRRFGIFSQLLTLSDIRSQLCAVASADYDDYLIEASAVDDIDGESVESLSDDTPLGLGVEERYASASRLVRPFLNWCRTLENQCIHFIGPGLEELSREHQPCALAFTESAIELVPHEESSILDGGDTMIRRMIQPNSGVEFRTLRVGEGGESAMIVLFSKSEAMVWLKSSDMVQNDKDALHRLQRMEERRVIEPIALSDLNLKAFSHLSHDDDEEVTCYRFVDPWEVEALENREGETKSAALGREHYLAFSVNSVVNSCEAMKRKLGGQHLLSMWSNQKGALRLTKAVASVHPPWERDAGGDLHMKQGTINEPSVFQNSIRQHVYRNALFNRLGLPQRFLSLVQVELLDLKNLNATGGAALSVFALLRLKREGSSAPLTNKARTLDSAATHPMKIVKSSGPNAPASWGSLVRFRFPLPEDVKCNCVSFDDDREALFKGPPCTLQLSVYEKKFMSDISLGEADIKLDALSSGGQMEEWVPLRSPKYGINWFARVRITLRFELMCLPTGDEEDLPHSVGLSKIQQLSSEGGTHEDKVKRSASTPDILSYFESMVY